MDMRYKYSAYCAQCRLMFENGEEMFSWEGEYICADCFDALFSELSLRMNTSSEYLPHL